MALPRRPRRTKDGPRRCVATFDHAAQRYGRWSKGIRERTVVRNTQTALRQPDQGERPPATGLCGPTVSR